MSKILYALLFLSVRMLCWLVAQLVFRMSGMRREWYSPEMRCSFGNVAEQTSSKVCVYSSEPNTFL